MAENDTLLFELSNLVTRALDEGLAREELDRLQSLIKTNPMALDYYYELIAAFACMDELKELETVDSETDFDGLLAELGRDEKTAPVLELPQEKPPRELIQKVVYPPKTPRKFPTASVVTFLTTAAAMLLAIAYVYLNPKQTPTQVATVLGTSRAVWSSGQKLTEQTRLLTCQPPMLLKKGLVQIQFDYGANVVIEGPAEFTIDSEKILNLAYGRVHTRVLDYGKGFTVRTPSSLLVDVGTEFGVQVNTSGDSQLHVLKGEVLLTTAAASAEKTKPMRFKAGQAVEVSRDTFLVRTIAVKTDFRDSLLEPVIPPAPPILFEDFESARLGNLQGQVPWTLTYGTSPAVVQDALAGRRSLRGQQPSQHEGGAVHRPLPLEYDLAVMTQPLYVAMLVTWDGRDLGRLAESAIIALNDGNMSNTNKVEGRFHVDIGTKLCYGVTDEPVYSPPGVTTGAGREMAAHRRYICVMKLMPVSATKTVVSLGYFDITDQPLGKEETVSF